MYQLFSSSENRPHSVSGSYSITQASLIQTNQGRAIGREADQHRAAEDLAQTRQRVLPAAGEAPRRICRAKKCSSGIAAASSSSSSGLHVP